LQLQLWRKPRQAAAVDADGVEAPVRPEPVADVAAVPRRLWDGMQGGVTDLAGLTDPGLAADAPRGAPRDALGM
jgi:hypothetical protein